MENVIVTGGTGFLGRNMIRRLCGEGYRVYAIVRPDSQNAALLPKDGHVTSVRAPLNCLTEAGVLPRVHFSALYHFAWGGVNRNEIDDDDVQRRNLQMSLEVVRAAVALECSCIIHAGSRSEYGRQTGIYCEDAPCRPQVSYGRYKLEFGEQAREICKGTRTRFIHTRIFSVYGPDDHPWSLIHTAIEKMMHNQPMELSDCTQLWNFMDVRDMADLLLTFQRQYQRIPENDSGILNVATRDIRPLRSFVEEIRRLTQSQSELEFGAFRQGVESALSLQPDMSKVEALFGWKQRITFAEGISHIIKILEDKDG